MWFDLLWYSLYCGGLGASLQYLWSISVNCKMTSMVKFTSHLSPYTVTTVLLIIFPRLCVTPLWLTCFRIESLCSWLLVLFSLLLSQTSLPLATTNIFSVSMSLGFFFFQILRISEIKWCLSFFGLHCLVQYTQGSPMLSQTADFLFYGWVVFHCVCMYTHMYIFHCVCVCVYSVCIYTHTYTYRHTYTYSTPRRNSIPTPYSTLYFPQPFEELLDCFLSCLYHFTFLTAVCKTIQIYPHNIFANICYYLSFWLYRVYKVVSHCGFDLHLFKG